jgi:very-short-patch-repair endonuclease
VLGIDAERQEFVEVKEKAYLLDFAIYCRNGKIDIETDGDIWHSNKNRIPEDNRRDNDLETHGWRTLRSISQNPADKEQQLNLFDQPNLDL